MTDLTGIGTGELNSALTAALFLTQFPQVIGDDVAQLLSERAAEIRAELAMRPDNALTRYLRAEGR
jgi:hypothetical protein